MTVWRLQVNTGSENIANYCLENNVAAMGWSIEEVPESERKGISSFEEYNNYAKKIYSKYPSVYRLAKEVKEGDIIWMRNKKEGKYYFGRVKENSKWKYNNDAVPIDAANQLTNIYWHLATTTADEDAVPGAVATAFIMGSTLQRINKPGVESYSQMLFNHFNKKENDDYEYPSPNLSLTEENFYSLLQPEDVEDLLCLWLYDQKRYIVIPSTNKIATPLYECVLINPLDTSGNNHIYIQVKKGNIDLDANDYSKLAGEVYLLTTNGVVKNADNNRIFAVSPKDIFDFATNPDKYHLIPENVQYWVKFLTNLENEKKELKGQKGIMFDTNLSYSSTNEHEMLSNGVIAAYGDAKRYVDSFNKHDYVLYYSKGRGIIAIGKIISDKSSDIQDGKSQKVELISPAEYCGDVSRMPCLSAREIKQALNRGFYFASTIKTPFLTPKQVEVLIEELNKKYTIQ